MLINSIIFDSFVDYKGEHSLVLFTKGCNLDCDVCYNKKIQPMYPQGIELSDAIKDNITSLHTAIVLTGGEPSIQDLVKSCKFIKDNYPSLKLKVFSNGQRPEKIFDCLKYVDCWSIDYKTPCNNTILGKNIDALEYSSNVCRTIKILHSNKRDFIIRIWKHPNSRIEDLHTMVNNIKYINSDTKYEFVDILR